MEKHNFVAAVDLGATNLRAALIREDGTVISFRSEETAKPAESEVSIPGQIASLISSMQDETNISPEAIGISTAGPVDQNAGSISPPNLNSQEILLKEPLSSRFDVPVIMLTDCKAGVLGEYFYGGANLAHTAVYITFSTGIGAGVISNGSLLSGADGNAGELGHLFVDSEYQVTCGCGGKGHWEAYSSGTGIPKFFRAFYEKKNSGKCILSTTLTAGQILKGAEAKSPVFLEFVDELAKINGRGLSSVITAYNPDLIILDGPIVRSYPSLIAGKMIGEVEHYLKMPEIRLTSLEGRAPLSGAAAAAFRAGILL